MLTKQASIWIKPRAWSGRELRFDRPGAVIGDVDPTTHNNLTRLLGTAAKTEEFALASFLGCGMPAAWDWKLVNKMIVELRDRMKDVPKNSATYVAADRAFAHCVDLFRSRHKRLLGPALADGRVPALRLAVGRFYDRPVGAGADGLVSLPDIGPVRLREACGDVASCAYANAAWFGAWWFRFVYAFEIEGAAKAGGVALPDFMEE